MDSLITIRHPTTLHPVITWAFAASGSAPADSKIKGHLIYLGKKPLGPSLKKISGQVIPGKTMRQPPNWLIGFRVKEEGFYILNVKLKDSSESESRLFRVKVRRKQAHGLLIGHPVAAGGPVDAANPIDGYGTCGSESSVAGRMSCANSHSFNAGPTATDPMLLMWTLTFNIPTSHPDHNTFTCEAWEAGNTGNAAPPESGIQVNNLS